MAEIVGCAIKVGGFIPFADHTYVRSSDGYVWPCFGNSDGGHEICIEWCNSAECNALAGRHSHAEISYALTGVCHQAANRILIPTGQTVHEAKGYSVSTALYGVYGTNAQEFFERHNLPHMQLHEMADSNNSEREFIMNVQNIYKSSNMIMKSNNDKSIDLASEEFKLLLQYKLDENSSNAPNKLNKNLKSIPMDKLVQIHKKFHGKLNNLTNDLNNKKLSTEEYANKINKEISNTLDKFSKELKPEDFEKVFGIKPDEKVNLVDPKIIANKYKK